MPVIGRSVVVICGFTLHTRQYLADGHIKTIKNTIARYSYGDKVQSERRKKEIIMEDRKNGEKTRNSN